MNWSKRGKEFFFNGFKGRSWTYQHSLSPNIEIQFNLSCREKINHFQRSWNQCAAFQVVKWGSFLITICSVLNFSTWFNHLAMAWVVFNSPLFESPNQVHRNFFRGLRFTLSSEYQHLTGSDYVTWMHTIPVISYLTTGFIVFSFFVLYTK